MQEEYNFTQKLKTNDDNFFKLWLTMLQPFLKLRKQEIDILSKFLYYRNSMLQQVNNNEQLANELLFASGTRKLIREELNINTYSFNNSLSALRKKDLIVNNTINKKIIPNIELTNSKKTFNLIYKIDIN